MYTYMYLYIMCNVYMYLYILCVIFTCISTNHLSISILTICTPKVWGTVRMNFLINNYVHVILTLILILDEVCGMG